MFRDICGCSQSTNGVFGVCSYLHSSRAYHVFRVIYSSRELSTSFKFEGRTDFDEQSKHLLCMIYVLFRWVRKYDDDVQVQEDKRPFYRFYGYQYDINCGLKCARCASRCKCYNNKPVKTVMQCAGYFVTVLLVRFYLLVPTGSIQRRQYCGFAQ